jgi:ureidoglycolate lyase
MLNVVQHGLFNGGTDMKEIKAHELSTANFTGYGWILSESNESPLADNPEFKYWGRVSRFSVHGELSSGILFCRARDKVVSQMERHVNTAEILAALSGDSVLCLAKKTVPGQGVDPATLRSFIIKQGQAVCLEAGTWHWIPYPLNEDGSKFLVAFNCGTEENDLEVVKLEEDISLI